MDDRIESALFETLARIDAGEAATEERLRGRYPDCWQEVLDALEMIPRLSPDAPETIGDWRIVSLLGRGGMGTVYLAQDARGTRRVALKVLAPGLVGSERARQRFRREAAVAARVEHPGICPVYEACVADDSPYLVMPYVEGETLERLVAKSRGDRVGSSTTIVVRGPVALPASPALPDEGRVQSDVDRVLLLVERVARALHAAHETGLVHRDVKPGNVMVTPTGWPVVLDFGLVRDDDEEAMTKTGALVGTPAYMAPEQIVAGGAATDRRVDVYALGVTLYECLALSRPFDAPTREALYACILRDEPLDLRRVAAGVSRDVAIVAATALEKSPDARYLTALDFAEDLRRARTGRPIRAKEASAVARVKRFCVRRPGVAVGVAATFVLMAVGLAVKVVALRHTRALDLADASKAAESSDPMLALLLAREAAKIELSPTIVSQLHGALVLSLEERVFRGHALGVTSAVWSPEGDRVLTTSADHTSRISTLDASAPVVLKGHSRAVSCGIFAPKEQRVLTGSVDGTTCLFDFEGNLIRQIDNKRGIAVSAIAWSHSGARMLIGYDDGAVELRDADGGPVCDLGTHAGRVTVVMFSPTDDCIVTASFDGDVRISNKDGKPIATLPHGSHVLAAAFQPKGALLLTGCEDGCRRIWDVTARSTTPKLCEKEPVAVTSVAFAHEGDLYLTALKDGSVHLWSVLGGRPTATLFGHRGVVSSATFSADDQLIVTCCAGDRAARVWDREGRVVAVFAGHAAGVRTVCFDANGSHVLSASDDGTARLWGVKGSEVSTSRTLPHGSRAVAVTGIDGDEVLVVPEVGPARLERRGGGKAVTFGGTDDRLLSARFSKDKKRVVTADVLGIVRIFDALNGSEKAHFQAHDVRCRADFARDGMILTWSDDSTAKLWDPLTPELPKFVFARHEGHVLCGAFSDDGDMVVTGSTDRTAIVWNAKTGKLVKILGDNEDAVRSVAFSHGSDALSVLTASGGTAKIRALDGRVIHRFKHDSTTLVVTIWSDNATVAVGCDDGSAWLWNADTGDEIARLPGHSTGVVDAEFMPDGSEICTACGDGNMRTRFVNNDYLLRLVEKRISRVFTDAELDRYGKLMEPGQEALLAAHVLVGPKLAAAVVVSDVTAEIEADASLSDDVRAAAKKVLEQQVDDPEYVRGRTWTVVREAGRTSAEYHDALRWAEIADDMRPENPDIRLALGVAQFRHRDNDAASLTLLALDKRLGDAKSPTHVACIAARALVAHAAGHGDETSALLARIDESFRADPAEPKWSQTRVLIDEALTFADDGAKSKTR
jgi:WD40 repeat protein/serine/threonine protein kinase